MSKASGKTEAKAAVKVDLDTWEMLIDILDELDTRVEALEMDSEGRGGMRMNRMMLMLRRQVAERRIQERKIRKL